MGKEMMISQAARQVILYMQLLNCTKPTAATSWAALYPHHLYRHS